MRRKDSFVVDGKLHPIEIYFSYVAIEYRRIVAPCTKSRSSSHSHRQQRCLWLIALFGTRADIAHHWTSSVTGESGEV